MAKLPWKPWHQVVKLRDDLRSGDLPLHMFAADLYDVIMQRGKRPIYEDPAQFFALTFPTHNLRRLVRDVVLRLSRKNDKAVRELALTYGGGKTHTLIALRHLVHDPDTLPDLPAVEEFKSDIGRPLPKCLVAALCFDKLDVEKGMEVAAPDGAVRLLRQPWSVLAFQIAGDEGLKLLRAQGITDERETAPAENLLVELLEIPTKKNLGVLVLIDEVLMYARESIGSDPAKLSSLMNFFQCLTQAATNVDGCCTVASLLTSNVTRHDSLGKKIQGDLSDIFQRQREEVIEPVVKEDIAEVLRRRFFTTESIRVQGNFSPHVLAALKGISEVDEQTAKQGQDSEDRFLKSYPFHPDLTEVLYSKWTNLNRFQRTRGVLRTFALALREAELWDESPLVGPAVFLSKPGSDLVSAGLQELINVADTEEEEGRRQAWTGILLQELKIARMIQNDSVGLKYREIEQTVIGTFLHSQPIGQSTKLRDLQVLVAATRPDKIELEKGLSNWARRSYWLDDQFTEISENRTPSTWRLGNRPNLTQMHAVAAKNISDEYVMNRLMEDIQKTKLLTANASAAGVKVHTLPTRPRDIEDDGAFHYAVLGPSAVSDSGKPNPHAKRFIDETTGEDKPRVYRNAIVLLAPSRDGLQLTLLRVRDYLAWEAVHDDIKKQERDGNIDAARQNTLTMQIHMSKGRIQDAIRQAYCIVITVSEKDDVQAFKITVGEDAHFNVIKSDPRSRMQETAITAETLLPDGPYNLWKAGETSRRVKDLAGAFAQMPHLPKMLKANAILDTLIKGCEEGIFVLRLVRPNQTWRSWWMAAPDQEALNDPALELVLPESAELSDIIPSLLIPSRLPGLWGGPSILLQELHAYFDGNKSITVQKDNYTEKLHIPMASKEAADAAVTKAVETGLLWLLSGPSSILGEPIPKGILAPGSTLNSPPDQISATDILPEILSDAWQDGCATGLSISTALSLKAGKTLPWKTVKDVIGGAVQARFIQTTEGSVSWPCDLAQAPAVAFKVAVSSGGVDGIPPPGSAITKKFTGESELEGSQLQDIGDLIPEFTKIKARVQVPIRFYVRVEIGDGNTRPKPDVANEVNTLLRNIKEGFEVK